VVGITTGAPQGAMEKSALENAALSLATVAMTRMP
jgi:hypothetical protein